MACGLLSFGAMTTQVRFTLDQLVVLDAIRRTGSFAAAARELHRVPSAISYAVSTLEMALDLALFDRSHQRAVLTPAGARIVQEAEDLLTRSRRLERLASTMGQGFEPDVRFVVDAAYPMDAIARVLMELTARDLRTRIHIEVECQDGVVDRFERDHADVMLTLETPDHLSRKAAMHALPSLDMVLVVASGHALATLENVSQDTLLEHTDIVVRDSSPRYRDAPPPTFLGTRHVVRVSDFHTKLLAIMRGVGFGWMPEHLVTGALADGKCVPVRLAEGHRYTYRPHLIERSDEALGRAGKFLVALLVADAADEPLGAVRLL